MSRTLRLFLLTLFFASPCLAQTIPAWEVFGGYSQQQSNVKQYYKSTPIIYTVRNQIVNLNGWDVSVTENINRWFGGTLDIRGHYRKPTVLGSANRERMYSVMYGPRFSFRGSPSIVPFANVLLGVAHMDLKVTPTGPRASDASFAMAEGGGLDLKFWNNAAIRVVQAEYLRANALGANQNSFRFSAGVILYLGK